MLDAMMSNPQLLVQKQQLYYVPCEEPDWLLQKNPLCANSSNDNVVGIMYRPNSHFKPW
jgi:hypothetical protein